MQSKSKMNSKQQSIAFNVFNIYFFYNVHCVYCKHALQLGLFLFCFAFKIERQAYFNRCSFEMCMSVYIVQTLQTHRAYNGMVSSMKFESNGKQHGMAFKLNSNQIRTHIYKLQFLCQLMRINSERCQSRFNFIW